MRIFVAAADAALPHVTSAGIDHLSRVIRQDLAPSSRGADGPSAGRLGLVLCESWIVRNRRACATLHSVGAELIADGAARSKGC